MNNERTFWDYYRDICFFIVTIGTIFLFSFLINREIEAIILVIAFHFFRGDSTKTFHASTMAKCWVCSNITFFLLSKLTANIATSIILHLLIAFILNIIMYHIWNYLRYIRPTKQFETKDDVMIYCEVNNLDEVTERRMIMRFIEKKKMREIADIECVELASIEQWFRRLRIKNELRVEK